MRRVGRPKNPGRPSNWSPERDRLLTKLYWEDNLSVVDIAKKIGVSERSVRYRIRFLFTEQRTNKNYKLTPIVWREVKKYLKTNTVKETAEKFGVHRLTIHHHLRKEKKNAVKTSDDVGE